MNENALQALVDGMTAQWQRDRANSQMTLGELIAALEGMDAATVVGLTAPHSYRGYYCDLAFEQASGVTAGELLAMCRESLGQTFTGYKGGDYVMGKTTPLWVASYGCGGEKLMGIAPTGEVSTEAD